MATKEPNQPKKLEILYILKILQEQTDAEHPLMQKEIVEKLENEYEMTVERKSVKRNIDKLAEMYDQIICQECTRTEPDGSTKKLSNGVYYTHDFEESEIAVMIDSVLFSNFLPHKQRKELIDKIANLGSSYTKRRFSYADAVAQVRPGENEDMFYTISILSEAISQRRQVSFNFCHYQADMKLHPKMKGDEIKRYVVNPYYMISHGGRYYLMCNTSGHDGIGPYRIDRIKNIAILDSPAPLLRSLKGYSNGFDLAEYISEHPHMWNGEVIPCVFRCPERLMDDVIDWFGNTAKVKRVENGEIEVSVRASFESMVKLAVQYAEVIEVVYPESLCRRVGEVLTSAANKYKKYLQEDLDV